MHIFSFPRKDDSEGATIANMVLLHPQEGLALYVIPKQASRELEGPRRLLPPPKMDTWRVENMWFT
jgi:hypothetical protein